MADKLTLSGIMEQRYTFYRTVLLLMTRTCPLSCRHCSIDAGPDHGECMPRSAIDPWLKGIRETGTVDIVAVSGGEPFVKREVLAEICSSAARHGLKPLVVTSAFWARDKASARSVLDSLPPFFALEISADEFHEEHIPLERIRNAALAAVERGVKVIIGLVHYRDSSFKDRLCRTLGSNLLREIEFLENTVKPLGRAEQNGMVEKELSEELPSGSCRLLSAPVVRYDGRVMACCNDSLILKDDHCLWLGDLGSESFAEIHKKAEQSFLIQALRTMGPKGVFEIAAAQGWKAGRASYDRDNICDLCRDIVSSPELPGLFERALEDETRRSEIAIGRFLKYGEVMPA